MGDPTDLIQFGVLGVILMLVLMGFLWPKPSVEEIKAQVVVERTAKEKAEGQRDALIETYQKEIIPAMRDANAGATRVVAIAESTQTTLTDTKKVLEDVRVLLLQKGTP